MSGRDQFLARVGANALDIVLRELSQGAEARAFEMQALHGLFGQWGELQAQREKLCRAIRAGEIDLQREDLRLYLRQSVYAQVMIDQPGYAGAAECGQNA